MPKVTQPVGGRAGRGSSLLTHYITKQASSQLDHCRRGPLAYCLTPFWAPGGAPENTAQTADAVAPNWSGRGLLAAAFFFFFFFPGLVFKALRTRLFSPTRWAMRIPILAVSLSTLLPEHPPPSCLSYLCHFFPADWVCLSDCATPFSMTVATPLRPIPSVQLVLSQCWLWDKARSRQAEIPSRTARSTGPGRASGDVVPGWV